MASGTYHCDGTPQKAQGEPTDFVPKGEPKSNIRNAARPDGVEGGEDARSQAALNEWHPLIGSKVVSNTAGSGRQELDRGPSGPHDGRPVRGK